MAPLLTALATVMAWLLVLAPAWAITAPELRSQRSLQDLQPNMHGRNLQQAEFLKASLAGFDFSDSDLRGADLQQANLDDSVAFASHFEDADLRGALLRNAMMLQSHFKGAAIEGADFTDAVLDMPEKKALCLRAAGTNPVSGVATRESLACR